MQRVLLLFSSYTVAAVLAKIDPTIIARNLALDAKVGFESPIPLPVHSTCVAGDSYHVNSVQYLFDHPDKLECIFAAGETPSVVPLGFAYGQLIAIANSGVYSDMTKVAYQGDYVVKTLCKGEDTFIGWLRVAGINVGTATWSIGTIYWKLAPGEYPLGDKQSILMDFTANFADICPIEGNESLKALDSFIPFTKSPFPLSHFKDLGRVVGVDSDGGKIMLNKAYISTEAQGAHTLLFYSVKSYDPSLLPPVMPVVVPLGPNGETVITSYRQGLEGVVKRVLELLSNPLALKENALREDGVSPASFVKDFEDENVPLTQNR